MEMITLADLYYNEKLNIRANRKGNEPLIDWQSVPHNFTLGMAEKKDDFIKLKKHAKGLIKTYGMNSLSMDDVMEVVEIDRDYAAAKKQQIGKERFAHARRPQDKGYQVHRGMLAVNNE